MFGDPGKVVIAGDWHGNTPWAEHVIRQAGEKLASEDERYLVHLGDFGFWHGTEGAWYLTRIEEAARQAGLRIISVRGNHENPDVVDEWSLAHAHADWALCSLPDGTRWDWRGRTWLAAGGAVSPDRCQRAEGVNWWSQEELSQAEADRIGSEGKADVLICHDVGAKVNLSLPPWPQGWDYADLHRSELHRLRMQELTDAVQPSYIMHGHYHMVYQKAVDSGYGPVRVTGFDMDGSDGNWAVLDTETMDWI